MDEASSEAVHGQRRHEERDVRLRPLLLAAGGVAIFAGAALLTMVWLFNYLARPAVQPDRPSPLLERGHLPPEPRLQVSPRRDLQVMWADEESVLGSYGWVDRQAGIVRIPISRAMELLTRQAEDRP
jgi:hypothetical protein